MPIAPETTTTFVGALSVSGDPSGVALVSGRERIDRAELFDRVRRRAERFDLPERSMTILTGPRNPEFVVSYLALLHAGHVPLLAGDHGDRLAAAWPDAARVDVGERGSTARPGRRTVALHPDLALLLTTSGSTGSPKLVRLSQRNLLANAQAIVETLGLDRSDRAITSLPLHYCYGLSVLHSHLLAGASVVLTDTSVVDRCFADAMRELGVTNLAGVPHTFDLLERADPERIHVPTLRFLTQAGGRMCREDVRRWTGRVNSWGADFYVMYGQTEATARMAYLPPAIAARRPEAIGVAVPGGELHLRPIDGDTDVGELVYRGDNVMMGYANGEADLAADAQLDELATGDLARFHADDGVFEIVGRRSRFVKPFGLRIDLDLVEHELGGDVAVGGDDERIVVLAPGSDVSAVRAEVVALTGLPASRIVVGDDAIPRTAAGKVDYAAIGDRRAPADAPPAVGPSDTIAGLYADVLGPSSAVEPTSTFVSLGGDSLNYVECSLRLEAILGHVPADWHLRSVADLAASAAPTGTVRRRHDLDTTILYRAMGICLIVATHMRVWFWPGGAHLLLAVAGYNLARFMMPIESTRDRVVAGFRTLARVVVPTVLWVGAGMVLVGAYSVGTLLLVNNYVGPASHRDDHWHFWFIEALVHLVTITTLLLAVPAVRRSERRWPYLFPLAALGVVLLLRLEWAHLGDFYNMRFRTHGVAWFFVLGWLIQRSTTRPQQLLTTALCLVTAPGFFGYPTREFFIAAALIVLVWFRHVPVPSLLVRPVGVVAGASMWIFITHFTFWPPLQDTMPDGLAYVLTIGAGVLVWAGVERLTGAVYARRRCAASSPC